MFSWESSDSVGIALKSTKENSPFLSVVLYHKYVYAGSKKRRKFHFDNTFQTDFNFP